MKGAGPDILYVLSNGFAARMVLQSDLLQRLHERGLRVAALSPNGNKDFFRKLCHRGHAEAIECPNPHNRLLSHYAQARRYLFEDFEKNAALRSKHQWEWHAAGGSQLLRVRPLLGKALNTALLRAPRARSFLHGAERRLLRNEPIRRLLEELQPRMLVTTYPVAWLEALGVLEAQRLGIPTVGHLLSWDNITCKGRFVGVPERFISWGPIMTQELREFYDVGASAVVEAGVAHFDLHARPIDRTSIAVQLRDLDLDPALPYLFFAMSAAYFAPREIDVVRWLASQVQGGAFGRQMQLVIRPHPQTIRGPMADATIVERLSKIAGARIAVDVPEVVSDAVDIGDRDMERFSALLQGAAVTLNSGSTVSIDALLRDRPVVLTLFDAGDALPWWESARRIEEFPHIVKLLSHGGVAVARSFEDLARHVHRYLADPRSDLEARRRTARAECGPRDGRACERIAEGLAHFLSAAEPQRSRGVHGTVSH